VVLGTSYLFGVKLLEGLHEALIQRYWSRSQDLFDVAFTKDIGPDHQIFWMQFLRKIYWSRPSDFWMQFLQKLLVQNIRFFGCSFYERYIGADPPLRIFLSFSNLLLQHLLMPFHSFWDEVSHRPRSALTFLGMKYFPNSVSGFDLHRSAVTVLGTKCFPRPRLMLTVLKT